MKKFLKGCLITAGILFVVGLLLCFIGKAYGGEEDLKDLVFNGKFNIELGEGVFGIQQFDIDDMDSFDMDFEITTGDVEKKLLAENCENIEIEIGGGELTFLPSEDEKIYIEATGVGKFQAYSENNEVKIKSLKTTDMLVGEITVYIPENLILEELNLSVGGGEIDMKNVEILANDIDIELGAGLVEADYIECRKLEVEVGAGQAVLHNIVADTMGASVGMGDITLSGDIRKSLDVECAMGNADFELAGVEEDFNYDVECAAGNIDLGGSAYSGLAMERTIDNGAEKHCSLECAMGNISVRFE